MARNWTPEERAKQAAAIRRWQPWNKSTGPRTIEGRAAVAQNADKGGATGRARRLAQALQELNAAIDKVRRLSRGRRAQRLVDTLPD